jgi:hypothetical protein
LLETHPQDRPVLQEFFRRLIRHYLRTGRLRRANR